MHHLPAALAGQRVADLHRAAGARRTAAHLRRPSAPRLRRAARAPRD